MESRLPDDLPLVGRKEELAQLRRSLEQAQEGTSRALLIRGESGVGKSRLLTTVADDARRSDWTVATGRAYPVGTGRPYAVFADAFRPVLADLDRNAIAILTRGSEANLTQLFPSLADADANDFDTGGSPSEMKARLFWNFTELLRGLSSRGPVLVVLEDLQWADEPSLELLHFVVRETGDLPIQVVGSYSDTFRESADALTLTEQSLLQLGLLDILRLESLAPSETGELIARAFGAEPAVTREFSALVHGWTRGNPFYLTETLKALVESGLLHQRDGTWLGWEADSLQLPSSVREAVLARMGHLSDAATLTAKLAAVLGTRVRYDVLRVTSSIDEHDLLSALEELRRRSVLTEESDGPEIFYAFQHPLVRETVYAELGRAHARSMHAKVAGALEAHHGTRALEHAEDLAFHFSQSAGDALAHKTALYLTTAGRRALQRFAFGPARQHLSEALALSEKLSDGERAALLAETGPIEEDLAQALQAQGDADGAIALLLQARSEAGEKGDEQRLLRVARQLAYTYFWAGRYEDTLEELDAGLPQVLEAGLTGAEASIYLIKGICLEQMGRPAEAERQLSQALAVADKLDDPGLQAKAHRALALNHLWMGAPDQVRSHGERAVQLAGASGQASSVLFWSHWLLAVLEGLTGDARAMAPQIERAGAVASDLRSPHLRLWTAELTIEHASASGDWERGIAIGEQAVVSARTLDQRTLLPRLQVWTALIHLGRGDVDRAQRLIAEAWEVSGAARSEGALDVHSVVPAHTGRAALASALGEYDEALRIGQRGLGIADRSGYFVWAVHRLLPVMAEACILKRDLDGAKEIAARLRKDSKKIGHKLGLAWADGCDALVAWLSGDPDQGIKGLNHAAEQLEAIPFVWDAARLRRQLAGRLAEAGDAEGALTQLRAIHDTFAKLGAEVELNRTREMFRELDARPPARAPQAGAGADALTSREVEIAHMVAASKSNKAIGKALSISPRTVSTHLSNIYKKVGVGSRAELSEMVRSSELPE